MKPTELQAVNNTQQLYYGTAKTPGSLIFHLIVPNN